VCRLAGDGAAAPVPQGRGEVTELGHTPTQQTIARRMSESRSTIPEFTLETEVLMDAAVHVREDLRFGALEPLPSFNDFVVHDGHIYGFDGSIFCCVDLATGQRRWKDGRYGHGQALLLADQGLLLVASETGDAVLLAADPERHRELGRFRAITGKTWNHPVLAHGRVYVRNAEEMACYELAAGR